MCHSRYIYAALLFLGLVLSGCLTEDDWVWAIPDDFPAPRVPESNPMSAIKVELGRHLFYETELSQNRQQSCASCHRQELAFTDGLTHAVGSTGEVHHRNALSLTNIAYTSNLTWSSPLITSLEQHVLIPLFGDDPLEMGLEDGRVVEARLNSNVDYVEMFAQAFPDDAQPVSLDNITKALAAFQRTLISGNSPYDRYLAGDSDALSPAAQRGMRLFLSERLECFHCHGGFNFSDSFDHNGTSTPEVVFHNTGLYSLDETGAYPSTDQGLFDTTLRSEDVGAFRAPTLRNIAVTAPYMHDGSITTLEEVIEHYSEGGRHIAEGPFAGDGFSNPLKSEFIVGFLLDQQEKADLIAFLHSLTDQDFLTNPAYSDPKKTHSDI